MKKSERFGLVLTPVEKTALAKMAEREPDSSQSAIVRRLIRESAKRLGLLQPHPITPPMEAAHDESR